MAENVSELMSKYPVFALGVVILFIGALSKPLFKINLFWLAYVGVIIMFIGLLIGYLRR